MLNKIKKSVAVVLVATFIISMFVIAPNAAETQNPNPVVDTTEYDVAGNNSLGDILADEIEDYKSQKNEADGSYVISDITMNGNAATVTYSAAGNCTVLVAVFHENSDEMLASGRVEASADENSVVVALETDNMPTAFVLRGFMLSDKNEPLSESYFSSMYTTDMQQLLESTVDDFEPERVLNLDEDKTTNFMVYSDDVKKFECTDKVNTISSADKENDTYVFTNADESLKSLKQGDIFVNDDDLDNILIIKVGTISVDGDTVTVTGEETTLEQVFECVKIESSGSLADAEVDESTGSSGITYVGSGKANENSSRKKDDSPVGASSDDGSVGAIDISNSIEYEHEFTFNNDGVEGDDDGGDDDDGWLSVEGSIEGKIGVSGKSEIKIYLSALGKKEISLVLSASLFYKSSIEGSFNVNPKLPSFKLPLIGNALSIDLTVGFFFEASGTFEIAFETGCSVGFSYSNEEGFKNLSKAPKADYAMNLEGEVSLGFTLDIAAVVADDEIGQAGFGGTVGLNITASPTSQDMKVEGVTVKHNCNRCVSGDISIELTLNPIVNILGKDVLPDEFNFETNLEWPLSPWHYSFTYGEFGLNLCDHVDCVFTIKVLKSGSPVEGAVLEDLWPGAKNVYLGKTDSLGMAQITLGGNSEGIYQIYASKGEDEAVVNFYVNDFEDILVRMSGTDWCSLSESGNFKYGTYTVNISKGGGPEPGTDPDSTDPNSTDPSSTEPNSTDPSSTNPSSTEPTTEPTVTKSGKYGDNITWELWSDGKLRISGSGDIDVATYTDYPWYAYREKVTSVEISTGITSIGNYAFWKCTSLTSVIIPNSVTSIGESAFSFCTSLTSVIIPNSVTSIGEYAFKNCTSLTSVKLSDSLTYIPAGMFEGCTSLTSITIPNSVTYIGARAFCDCKRLTNVTLSNSLKEIGGGAFEGCKSLQSITLPNSLNIIGADAFYKCCLTSITIPDGVTEIGSYAFYKCNFTSITIPDSVTKIGGSVFSDCTNLTSIKMSNNIESFGGGVFRGTKWYNNQPNGIVYFGNIACDFKETYKGERENITSITLAEGTKIIAVGIFSDFKSLTSVTIPDSVTSISVLAFQYCESLKSLTIPDSVTSIDYGAFWGCYSLTSITIPDSVTSIGDQSFESCVSLTSITIPDSVTNIGYRAFFGCENLANIKMSKNVERFGYNVFDDTAWYDNQPLGVVYIDYIAYGFKGGYGHEYYNVESLNFKEGTKVIADNSFEIFPHLTSLTIPDSVIRIGDRAFELLDKLTSVTIPAGVKSIGYRAFYGCYNLTSVTMSKNTTVHEEAFPDNHPVKFYYYEYDNGVGASPCGMGIDSNEAEIVSTSSQNLSADADVTKITAEYKKAANAKYIIAVVKDETFEDVLSVDNLLYITQVTADKYGEISVSMPVSAKVTDYDVVIFGPERSDDTPDKPIKGDVDGSGKVTVDDVTAIQKYAADTLKFDDVQIEAADVDGNGKVNIDDVTMIQKYIADMISSLG